MKKNHLQDHFPGNAILVFIYLFIYFFIYRFFFFKPTCVFHGPSTLFYLLSGQQPFAQVPSGHLLFHRGEALVGQP